MDFDIIKDLGAGAYGQVQLVSMKNVLNSAKFALKCIDTTKAIKKMDNNANWYKANKEREVGISLEVSEIPYCMKTFHIFT